MRPISREAPVFWRALKYLKQRRDLSPTGAALAVAAAEARRSLHHGADYLIEHPPHWRRCPHIELPDGVSVAGVELSKPTELWVLKAVGQAGNLRYGILSAFENESQFVGQNDQTGDAAIITNRGEILV